MIRNINLQPGEQDEQLDWQLWEQLLEQLEQSPGASTARYITSFNPKMSYPITSILSFKSSIS